MPQIIRIIATYVYYPVIGWKKPSIWALIFIAAKARAKLFFLIMQTATENNNIIEMTMVVS